MNNNKQLTPEETKSTQTNDALSFFKIMCPTLYGDISLNHARMIVETMRRYANNKTAPKDEEIRHLKGWKEEQIKTFAPLLDYGQSPECGLQLAASIVEAAVDALKNQKEKAEENTKLRQHNAGMVATIQDRDRALLEKDERIKELEAHLQVFKEELDSVLSLCGVQHVAGSAKNVPVTDAVTFKLKEKSACIAKLEKDKAEFDNKAMELMVHHEKERDQLLEKVEQLEKDLNESNKLLCEWRLLPPIIDNHSLCIRTDDYLTILSSREKKSHE